MNEAEVYPYSHIRLQAKHQNFPQSSNEVFITHISDMLRAFSGDLWPGKLKWVSIVTDMFLYSGIQNLITLVATGMCAYRPGLWSLWHGSSFGKRWDRSSLITGAFWVANGSVSAYLKKSKVHSISPGQQRIQLSAGNNSTVSTFWNSSVI